MTVPSYLLTFQRAVREQEERAAREGVRCETSERSEESPTLISLNTLNSHTAAPTAPCFGRFDHAFAELEQRCPDHIDLPTWQTAVSDGRIFLARWGTQAERFGWTVADIFGLHEPPEHAAATYRRLARLDCAGLTWCLNGRPVIALTSKAATIAATAGTRLTWRRSVPGDGV